MSEINTRHDAMKHKKSKMLLLVKYKHFLEAHNIPNNWKSVCSKARKQSSSVTEKRSLAELRMICTTAGATRPHPDSSEPFTKYRKILLKKWVIKKCLNSEDWVSVVRRIVCRVGLWLSVWFCVVEIWIEEIVQCATWASFKRKC